MFRDFVQRKARALGLSGSVRNRDDGTVEVVAQGEKEKLEKLVGHLRKGSVLSYVSGVDVEWRETKAVSKGFYIVYSR